MSRTLREIANTLGLAVFPPARKALVSPDPELKALVDPVLKAPASPESLAAGEIEISGIAGLEDAGPGQLTFLFNRRFRSFLSKSKASAVILRKEDAGDCPLPYLVADNPRLEWARVAGLFDRAPVSKPGVHPAAVVSADARIGAGVMIAANAVVEAGATLGDGVVVGANVFVGENASIGYRTRLHANVTVYHGVSLGDDCLVHSGVVIGADGFGFEFDPVAGAIIKIPQIYAVRIGNDVEIGAGTTIDRGALADTVIGNGVKIDNQVQVGHATRIGDHTVISGCTAIAGSTRIGRYCRIGGAVGIVDNIEVADFSVISAMSLVSRSIKEGGRYSSGTGLLPGAAWRRSVAGFARLPEILRRLKRLESK